MRVIHLAAVLLLLLALSEIESPSPSKTDVDPQKAPPWSEAVNGLQARIVLKRSQVVNGTPILATYLVLRNVSNVMNPLTIPWNEKLMKFNVVDAKGADLPKFNGPFDGASLAGTVDLVLPVRSELSFDYSSHGVGIPGNKPALIDLGVDANWVIDPGRGEFFLRAILEVPEPKALNNGPTRPWHGKIELPPIKIPLNAGPQDNSPSTTSGDCVETTGNEHGN